MNDRINVGSALIGVLVTLALISVYLSYEANKKHDSTVKEMKSISDNVTEMESKVTKIENFIDQNEFVK